MANFKELYNNSLFYILSPDDTLSGEALEGLLDIYDIEMGVGGWYDRIKEYGYLVKFDSKVGFMYIIPECHTSQYRNTEGLKTALAHGKRTVDSVLELVCETATIIAEQYCEVYVGNCTNIDKQHELCVFFPYETDIAVISKTIGLANGTIKELALKKWNSLVDVIKYG